MFWWRRGASVVWRDDLLLLLINHFAAFFHFHKILFNRFPTHTLSPHFNSLATTAKHLLNLSPLLLLLLYFRFSSLDISLFLFPHWLSPLTLTFHPLLTALSAADSSPPFPPSFLQFSNYSPTLLDPLYTSFSLSLWPLLRTLLGTLFLNSIHLFNHWRPPLHALLFWCSLSFEGSAASKSKLSKMNWTVADGHIWWCSLFSFSFPLCSSCVSVLNFSFFLSDTQLSPPKLNNNTLRWWTFSWLLLSLENSPTFCFSLWLYYYYFLHHTDCQTEYFSVFLSSLWSHTPTPTHTPAGRRFIYMIIYILLL